MRKAALSLGTSPLFLWSRRCFAFLFSGGSGTQNRCALLLELH
jgi:hypothetical protein